MMPRSNAMLAALLALLTGSASALAQTDASLERDARQPDDDHLSGRIDVSHSLAVDDQTARTVSFTDLRLALAAVRLAGLPIGVHVDGRARHSWNDATDDRLAVHEAYLRYGDDGDTWRVSVGRQLIRPVATAEIDGLRIERQLGANTVATAFGGLVPQPVTGELSPELTGAGAGYERRTRTGNHAGGVVGQWYGGEVDRVYATQRSYLRLGRTLGLSGFGIVDFLATDPLFGAADSDARGLDLTALHGMARYTPTRWLDTTLTGSHNHTVLPGIWWRDWLAQKRRELGFELDGDEPVGTRITSVRWTNNLRLSRDLIPYTRLRYDWRHTDDAEGYEARGGIKWRPKLGYVDASYAHRKYFSSTSQLASLTAGAGGITWGAEGGLLALRSRPLGGADARTSYDAHAMLWLALGDLLGLERRIHVAAQYRGLFDPEIELHSLYLLVGYRM